MVMIRNSARERLERGELSLGVGVRIVRGVEIAKAMKTAGFDWLSVTDLGIPGELGHARVVDAYARMIAACRAERKWPGMGGVYDEPLMRRYIDMGARFILGGADLAFLLGGATRRVAYLHEIKPAK